MLTRRWRWCLAAVLGVAMAVSGCSTARSARIERDLRRHNFDRAVEHLDRLLRRDLPDNERAAHLVQLAVALEEGGMASEDDPLTHLDEAVDLAPGNATARLVRAQMRAVRGVNGAVADADAALARASAPDAEFLATAGDVYLLSDEPDSAVIVYERALSLEPEPPLEIAIHRNLAIAHREMMDFGMATAHSARHIDMVRSTGGEPSPDALAFHTVLLWLSNDISGTVRMLNASGMPRGTRQQLIDSFSDPNLNAALAAANRRGR
jgi:tetratricopeptide (TPR) repeat protein